MANVREDQNEKNLKSKFGMAKVRYNLHNPKEKETLVRLVYRYPAGRLVWYTGVKVKPGDWNQKTMRVRGSNRLANAINQKLDTLEAQAEKIALEYWNRAETLPLQTFRQELTAFAEGRVLEKQGGVSLLEFFEQLIQERRASGVFSRLTVNTYRSTLAKVGQYEKETRRKVDFDRVDLDFHGKFTGWLAGKGYRANYIHKVIRTLKSFLAVAYDRGLTNNTAFRSRAFTAKQEEVEHIYLNEDELNRMESAVLDKRLDRVRDLFLIGCYTGLRFSDYTALTPANIVTVDGVELFTIVMQKTRRRVSMPVFPQVRRILDKRGGVPPAGMSNQKLNKYVREVCRAAGLSDSVTVTRFKGGLRVDTSVEKWTLVTSHTARRSFATNEYLRAVREGRSYRPIMDILGHRTERVFFRYIKVSSEQTAVEFARARRAG